MGITREQLVTFLEAQGPAELRALIAELEERWGVERVVPPRAALATEELIGVPYGYDVVLLEVEPGARIPVIKRLRALLGLGLREARALVDACPARVAEDVQRDEAQRLRDGLEGAGARVKL